MKALALGLILLPSLAHADPLQDTIVADLKAAAALATANGDTNGAACWNALSTERINVIIVPKSAGLFQLAEAARLTQSKLSKPIISDATAQACGPVARDAGATINQIAARVGLGMLPVPFKGF